MGTLWSGGWLKQRWVVEEEKVHRKQERRRCRMADVNVTAVEAEAVAALGNNPPAVNSSSTAPTAAATSQ